MGGRLIIHILCRVRQQLLYLIRREVFIVVLDEGRQGRHVGRRSRRAKEVGESVAFSVSFWGHVLARRKQVGVGTIWSADVRTLTYLRDCLPRTVRVKKDGRTALRAVPVDLCDLKLAERRCVLVFSRTHATPTVRVRVPVFGRSKNEVVVTADTEVDEHYEVGIRLHRVTRCLVGNFAEAEKEGLVWPFIREYETLNGVTVAS
mmetsp:Transcript_40551/g.101422  ORF Transcript_40551/g.101422 Transcript_40551/m.101422 type:complete len:204 (-) Transcript_40551:496-1107(-)